MIDWDSAGWRKDPRIAEPVGEDCVTCCTEVIAFSSNGAGFTFSDPNGRGSKVETR